MYDYNVLKTFFLLSRLPISVYTKEWVKCAGFESAPRSENKFEEAIFHTMRQSLLVKSFEMISYEEGFPIGICGCKDDDYYYILGPFSYGRTDNVQCRRFMRKHRLEEFAMCRLDDALNIANFLLGNGLTAEDTLGNPTERQESEQQYITREELRQMDAFQKNHTYMEEDIMFEHVREGNAEYLRQHMEEVIVPYPVLLDDVKKNEEYMTVLDVSMAARAAIEGGISSHEAFLRNDVFLKKISLCKDLHEIQKLKIEGILHFAELVHKNKQSGSTNRHVEECKNAVRAKSFEKISLDKIAADAGISQEYMQKIFKQHEGIPITEYIAKVKMEEACNMLRYSDRQIREIAEYLNYNSVSHFSAAFKKKMKMTPKEYREKNQKTNF